MFKLILFLFCVISSTNTLALLSLNSKVRHLFKTSGLKAHLVESPFEDVIPFLSEHVQLSDQMLFLGASTDFPIEMVRMGFGTKKTGFMVVIDNDESLIQESIQRASSSPDIALHLKSGRLKFETVDYLSMKKICKQSSFDSIVDFGGLDSILLNSENGIKDMQICIDQLQNAVRLGNILVCISKLDKEVFCSPFQDKFGWVQELDGDPGEISAWYRGKTNIPASKSNFKKHGLNMFVYTNTDNC